MSGSSILKCSRQKGRRQEGRKQEGQEQLDQEQDDRKQTDRKLADRKLGRGSHGPVQGDKKQEVRKQKCKKCHCMKRVRWKGVGRKSQSKKRPGRKLRRSSQRQWQLRTQRRRRLRRLPRQKRVNCKKYPAGPQLPGSFASFCVRCRQISPTFNRSTVILYNGVSALRGNCAVCHSVKFRFMSRQEFMSRIIGSTATAVTYVMQVLATPIKQKKVHYSFDDPSKKENPENKLQK